MLNWRRGWLVFFAAMVGACGGKAVIDGQPGASGAGGMSTTTTDSVVVSVVSSSTGSTSYQPECREDADCQIYDGCCGCWGTPVGIDPEPVCGIDCGKGLCSTQGIPLHAWCVRGQCTTTVSCGQPATDCPSGGPICATGLVTGLNGACPGFCLPPTECTGGLQVQQCPTGTFSVQLENGVQCVPDPGPGVCPGGVNCACVGDAVCELNEVCLDTASEADIRCEPDF